MAAALAAFALIVAGCSGGPVPRDRATSEVADGTTPASADDTSRAGGLDAAERRAVVVETGGCGAADPSRGSGLALTDDRVLTAAHVVASGGPVEITVPGAGAGATKPATLVAYDPTRDLALLTPASPLVDVPAPPPTGDLDVDDDGVIIGAATSGRVPATIELVTVIEMDDVRATTRSSRRGYRVAAATEPGDSGAGLYDDDGRLIGLLFAVSTVDAGRTWVTAANEIEDFLADRSVEGSFACDPDDSRVERVG